MDQHFIASHLKLSILPIAVFTLLGIFFYFNPFHILLPTFEQLRDSNGRPHSTGSDSQGRLPPKGNYDAGSSLTIRTDSNPTTSFPPLEHHRGQNVQFGLRGSIQGGKDECGEPPLVPMTLLTDLDDPLAGEWPLHLFPVRCALGCKRPSSLRLEAAFFPFFFVPPSPPAVVHVLEGAWAIRP